MSDQPTDTKPVSAPAGMSSGMRAMRAAIGTVLLSLMVGKLLATVAPDWLATARDSMPACCSGANCSVGTCPTGGCCSEMTSIGLPTSVLEQSAERQLEAREQASE